MELAAAVIVYTIVAAIGFARRDRIVHSREVSLCLTCTNAVVTHGTRGQEWIACNFGGAMRAMKFTVCSFTGYRATSVSEKLVTIEGFAPKSAERMRKSRSRRCTNIEQKGLWTQIVNSVGGED